jgi:predicted HTH transcriptional regulator
MNKKKLKTLIKKEEGSKLDFKLKVDIFTESGRKELAKDVCAIANSRGGRGYLIIGIEDKTKKIIGIEDNIYNEEKIQQIISSRCDPPIPISLDYINLQNKTIGVITIYN